MSDAPFHAEPVFPCGCPATEKHQRLVIMRGLPLLLVLACVPVVAGLLLAGGNASRDIALLTLLTTGGLALAIYLRVTCKRAKPAPGAAASKPNKE